MVEAWGRSNSLIDILVRLSLGYPIIQAALALVDTDKGEEVKHQVIPG